MVLILWSCGWWGNFAFNYCEQTLFLLTRYVDFRVLAKWFHDRNGHASYFTISGTNGVCVPFNSLPKRSFLTSGISTETRKIVQKQDLIIHFSSAPATQCWRQLLRVILNLLARCREWFQIGAANLFTIPTDVLQWGFHISFHVEDDVGDMGNPQNQNRD